MSSIRVNINPCTNGATVRYYMNGWHHFQFNDRYESEKVSEVNGTQVIGRFSAISRIEQPTGKTVKLFYNIGAQGVDSGTFEGLKGILYAETVELYLNGRWAEVEIDRSSFPTRPIQMNAYDVICRLRIKNIGDIERAAIVPIPVVEPILIYYEDFEGELPWGYTVTKYNENCEVEQAEVDGTNKLKIIAYSDGPNNGMRLRIELPDWELNHGYLRAQIEIMSNNYTQLYHNGEYGYRYLALDALGLIQDIPEAYSYYKQVLEFSKLYEPSAPMRYINLFFAGQYGSFDPLYTYINWVKVEKL